MKISFHYALNAPCAYYAFLISKENEENSSRNLNVDGKDGSENISAAQKMLFISLGKWKCQSETRYTAFRLSLLGYDSLLFCCIWFFFFIIFFFCFLAMRWEKGFERFHDENPRLVWWYTLASTSHSSETFFWLKVESFKSLKCQETFGHSAGSDSTLLTIENSNFAVCNLIVLLVKNSLWVWRLLTIQ